jgi:hypothetical protein
MFHIFLWPLLKIKTASSTIYGFLDQANLDLNGIAEIRSNGLLQLTNLSRQEVGRAFYHFPMKFNTANYIYLKAKKSKTSPKK